jgi:hypothetical protein
VFDRCCQALPSPKVFVRLHHVDYFQAVFKALQPGQLIGQTSSVKFGFRRIRYDLINLAKKTGKVVATI